MRNILNVIVDILTLLVVAIAGVGHMLPWFSSYNFRIDDQFRNQHWEKKVKEKGEVIPDEQKRAELEQARQQWREDQVSFQAWHASRSGAALGVLCLLVFISLAFSPGPMARRILVLLMFFSALAAILAITLSMTPYHLTDIHRRMSGTLREDVGFFLSLVPACFALGFCLLRMIWTMPPVRVSPAPAMMPPRGGDPLPVRLAEPGHNPEMFKPKG